MDPMGKTTPPKPNFLVVPSREKPFFVKFEFISLHPANVTVVPKNDQHIPQICGVSC